MIRSVGRRRGSRCACREELEVVVGVPVHVPRAHLRHPLVALADLRAATNAREVELQGRGEAPVERVDLPELVAEFGDLAVAHVRVERQVDRHADAGRRAGDRVGAQGGAQRTWTQLSEHCRDRSDEIGCCSCRRAWGRTALNGKLGILWCVIFSLNSVKRRGKLRNRGIISCICGTLGLQRRGLCCSPRRRLCALL